MKKYQCPYCTGRYYRNDLAKHIEKEHDDLLPENYTAYRMAYDIVNDKPGHGICTECGRDTTWNEKTQKYNRLCGRKECYEKVKLTYQKRMLRVHHKIHLLDDPMQQEKMLANRKISGQYKWSKGGRLFTYTGQYEKKLLEFLDKGMNYNPDDIITPGPVLEYTFKGETHKWITDMLIVPYNLIIEVKDGGDNPNNRSMPLYRSKQIAKETMITNLGKFSYLRLTNNDFSQLFTILSELKLNSINLDTSKVYRINEEFIVNRVSELLDTLYELSDILTIDETYLSFFEGQTHICDISPKFINGHSVNIIDNCIGSICGNGIQFIKENNVYKIYYKMEEF